MSKNESLFQVLKEIIHNKRNNIPELSTQESLGFEEIYPSGIVKVGENRYNKMIQFSDISYHISSDDERKRIFSLYSTLLNSFDHTVDFQLYLVNYRLEETDNSEEVLEYNKEIIGYEELRKDYFDYIEIQKQKGSNGFVRNKYFTFTVEDKNYRSAVRRLETISQNIRSSFNVMGVHTEELNGVDRLVMLNYLFNNLDNPIELENIDNESFKELKAHDLIAPKRINFYDTPNTYKMNKRYGSTLYFNVTSTELSDRVLSDFTSLDHELVISIHIKPNERQSALKMVKVKETSLKAIKIEEQQKSYRRGYDMDLLPGQLNDNINSTNKMKNDLSQENENFFDVTVTVTVIEDSPEELDETVYTLETIASKNNCEMEKMTLQQEQAFISSLPFANNKNEKEKQRGLLTTSTAVFMPFTTLELYQEDNDPIYYGLNTLSNNLIQVSRKSLKNPNGLFLGTPGSENHSQQNEK